MRNFFYKIAAYMRMPFSVLLMSGEEIDCSRYCIASWDPLIIVSSKGDRAKIWERGKGIKEKASWEAISFIDQTVEELSNRIPYYEDPFIGGFTGYISYEYKNLIEPHLPQNAKDDLMLSDMLFIFPSKILVFDKKTRKMSFYKWDNTFSVKKLDPSEIEKKEIIFKKYHFGPISSNFSRDSYIEAVEKVRSYIRQGDVYQVNLSQRFFAKFEGDALTLFFHLFSLRPAPFYAYINAGDHYIVSTSMERFLWSDGEIIETRPIKGTRPRGKTKEEDLRYKNDLFQNPKDDAELSMIVDLLRNDIGKICVPGTVKVREHKRIETYSYVHHLVSIIEGSIIEEKKNLSSIIRATFPGGSITGCPKIRAMEIIDELEPNVRHVYTGSIGYFGIHKRLDLSIAIRTLIIKDGVSYYGAGGGIVYDSDPVAEYEETLSKAEVFFKIASAK